MPAGGFLSATGSYKFCEDRVKMLCRMRNGAIKSVSV